MRTASSVCAESVGFRASQDLSFVKRYSPECVERLSEKSWKHPSVALQTTVKALLDPFRPPHKIRIRLRSPPRTPFRTVSPRSTLAI